MPAVRSKKYLERLELARRTENGGFESMPCSTCIKENRKCIVSDGTSERCAECTRKGLSCDVIKRRLRDIPTLSDWASIDRQQEVLRLEEEKAFQASQEITAKILNLRKRQEFLRRRATKMLDLGVRTLAELDELEAIEKERELAEENRKRDEDGERLAQGLSPIHDLSLFNDDFTTRADFSFDLPVWDQLSPAEQAGLSHLSGDMPSGGSRS
jgi:hypothetical protein